MPEEQTQAPAASEQQDQTQATTPAEAKNTDTQPQELTIPKHRYDEVSKRLRELEAEQAKQAKEREQAEEKRLQEQQQWRELYEGNKTRVQELTPKAELADKLSAMVLEQYAAEIKEWPEQVRNMAPNDDADVLTKLAWKERAKPLAMELMGNKAPPPGNGRKPPPTGGAGSGQQQERARAEQAQWLRRQF